ncbi:MAG: hypothetical protein RL077_3242 [Verrucomicrobiota bacterium]
MAASSGGRSAPYGGLRNARRAGIFCVPAQRQRGRLGDPMGLGPSFRTLDGEQLQVLRGKRAVAVGEIKCFQYVWDERR